MTRRFCYNIYIPSIAKEVGFYELCNRDYLNILKFIQNKDNQNLSQYLERMVKDLCSDESLGPSFSRLDKYCILLHIIMVCIGNHLEFNTVCKYTEKPFKVDIIISDIISKINELDISEKKLELGEDNYIVLTPPDLLYSPSGNSGKIKELYLNKETYNLDEFSEDQQTRITDLLPGGLFVPIHEMVNNIAITCSKVTYFTYRSPHSRRSSPINFKFNIYNNTFFDFIVLLLKEDLLSYYKLYYGLTTKFKFDMSYVQSITPAETKMFLSFVHEDVAEKKKQIDISTKQQQASFSMPKAPAMPEMPDISMPEMPDLDI